VKQRWFKVRFQKLAKKTFWELPDACQTVISGNSVAKIGACGTVEKVALLTLLAEE